MNNPFRGILLLWSLGVGAGKTTALKEWSYDLKKIFWIRYDPKPVAFDVSQLGLYYNLDNETKGMIRWQIGEWFINQLDKADNKFDGIVIDTYRYLGECITAMVDKEPTKYRENFNAKPEYKYPQIKKEGHIWHSKVLSRMAEQFQFVGLATHDRVQYDSAGIVTGLKEPDIADEVIKAASDIWLLTRGDGAYCPTALVSKNGAKDIKTDRGNRTMAVLPEKVSPLPGETSIWDAYERYWNNPISKRERPLESYEIPDATELSYIKGIMTPDQLRSYQLNKRIKEDQIQQGTSLSNQELEAVRTIVLEMKDQPLPVIFAALEPTYGSKYDFGTISKILNGKG